MRLAFLIPPMMLLAACGQKEQQEHPEISINAGDEKGGVQITTNKDGSGRLKIGGDGTAIDMTIPDFVDLDIGSDFDIDGVTLYPGSKVTSVQVDDNRKITGRTATVKLGFTSPAAPAKASEWMASEFARKGVKITRAGDALSGTDADGDDFTIRFAPDAAATKGEVLIVSK
ncbi:MAG: hypothetical protein DI569_02275 [Sphingopyxis macrogoltabida]|uniref:Lipoprotein n=1 Tax=Sphingopyxis macrogoltabida TaxID=33050 RepID=A0A2W5L7G1_SPHMC|nr:MAG: hypothetical protein DI569_02275 [Sphingopyxis macrogoltabida]